MEPALLELYAEGSPDDEVAVLLRLAEPAALPDGVRIVAQFGPIATCRLRRGDIPRVRGADPVWSMKAAQLYGPTPAPNDLAHSAAPDGTDDLAKDGSGDGNPGEAALHPLSTDQRRPDGDLPTGRGVVVAHIDWGVDFVHPDFREADGKTRLLALWDQSSSADPKRPNRYGYGRIYEASDIDRALAAPDPYAALGYDPAASDSGSGSHGTHTLSISAGNGRSGGPVGLAPEAHLIFVHLSTYTAEGPSLLGDSVALFEAFDFIVRVVGPRPFVVNCSLGRHAGQHDGRTLTEQGMDAFLLATPGRAIVQSTGNYFDRCIHARGTLRPGESRTLRLIADVADRTPNEVDLWYPGVDRFQITLRGPGGAPEVRVGPGERSPVTVDGREVGRLYHRLKDPNNGDNQVTLFLYHAAPPGEWKLILFGQDIADGRFHAWVERDAACKGCQARFAPDDSDPTSTTGTICNGLWTLAVGAYDAHQEEHPLTPFSSCGPTRDGRERPHVVAPGKLVLAARSRPRFAGPDPPLLTRMSGTSMAAPHVTGTVALMFAAAGRPLFIEDTRRLLLANVDLPADDVGPTDRLRLGSGYLNTAASVAAAEQAGRRAEEPGAPLSSARPSDPHELDQNQRYEPMSASSDETAGPDVVESDETTGPFGEDPADADEGYDTTAESSAEATGDEPDEYEAEARRDHRRGHRRDHRRQSRRVVAPSPFQVQVPLTGGPPALAVPVGGLGSPLAFTVPLGGTPPATSPAPVQTGGPVSPKPSAPQTDGPTPPSSTGSAPPEVPATEPTAPEPPVTEPLATEPPVTVASPDFPLYVPPAPEEMGTKATEQPAELDEYDAEAKRDRKRDRKRAKRDRTRDRKRGKRDRARDRMRSSRRVVSPSPVQAQVPLTGGGAPPATSPAPMQTGVPASPPPSAPQTDEPTPPSPTGSAPPEVPATEPAAPEPPVTEPLATEPPVTVASPDLPLYVPPAPGDMGTNATGQPAEFEEYDAEAKRDRQFSPSPFQVQVPLTGGGAALALPLGGFGSPLAFTIPLGGPPPAVSPPSVQTGSPAQPAASEPFTSEPPVTVAVPDSPLYVPPADEAIEMEAMEQPEAWQEVDTQEWSPAEWGVPVGAEFSEDLEAELEPEESFSMPEATPDFGEQVLAAAEAAAEAGDGTAPSSAALLEILLSGSSDLESEAEGMAVPLSPLGHHGPSPSATTLFNAFVYPNHPLRPRNALHRHCARCFQILAYPGQAIRDLDPRQGDLLLRVARGEGWGHVAVVASRELHRYDQLGTAGLRGEGYPRLRPGLYIRVVEVGPRRRRRSDRFARRLCDGAGRVLSDTLLLRPLFPRQSPWEAGAEPGSDTTPGAAGPYPSGPVRPPALRRGDVGPAVREAQRKLNRVHADAVALGLPGLAGCPLVEDGCFGERMEIAVRSFQQQVLGDPAEWNGVIGPKTWAQLDLLTGAATPKTPPAPAALSLMSGPVPPGTVPESSFGEWNVNAEAGDVNRNSPDYIRWVQSSLNQILGTQLVVDGVMGSKTSTAIRSFQQQRGLTADGIVGSRTEEALRAVLGGGASVPAATPCTTLDGFPQGTDTILPAHQLIFIALARRILAENVRNVDVTGFASNEGSDAENIALGQRRAERVTRELRATLDRMRPGSSRALTVTTRSRGENEQIAGGDRERNRRVTVCLPSPRPAQSAEIVFVIDDDNDHLVNQAAPVTTFVGMGLWNAAYDGPGNVRNGQAETDNFVGSDRHRFYIRVRDPAATTPTVTASWRTLLSNLRDDDAPANQTVTLTATAPGSKVFVSKALMLVTDETDASQSTRSGLAAPHPDAGLRVRGQSNHRLRRGRIDGFVRATYRPASGSPVEQTLPIFRRRPTDFRRRVKVRVINYGSHATAAFIAGQFAHANARWNQIGGMIEGLATVDRPVPAAALDRSGQYPGGRDSAQERAALNDLIPITPNNTVTAVFVRLSGTNAYTTLFERTAVALGERYFMFIRTPLDLNDDTLAHELFHVLFNRGDVAVADRFYTFNTNPPTGLPNPSPDVRTYRRIQDLHSPDPDNDPGNDNILNWARRRRTARFPIAPGHSAPTNATGNNITEVF